LFVLTAISTCGFIDRVIMSVLVHPIKAEFHLSDTEVGLVGGFAFALLNVLLGIWVARIAERRRRVTLIGVGTFLWSVATALCAATASFLTLALARVGVGVGEAVGLPSSQSVVSDYFPKEKRTTAISVLVLAPPVGAFIGLTGGGLVAQEWGWRAAFLIAALPGFLLSALVLLTVAEPPRGQHDGLGAAAEQVPPLGAVLARMWGRHSFRHLLIGSTVASAAGFGVNLFLTTWFVRRFGYSLGEAGLTTGLIASLPAVLGVVGSGWLTDRMARHDARAYATVPGLCLLLTTPLYILAVTRDSAGMAIALLGLVTLLQYNYLGPSQGVFQNLMHPRMRATSTAVIGIAYSLIGAGVGPWLVGGLSDHFAIANGPAGGLTTALALTALLYLWAAAHFYLARRWIRDELALPL
jgi:MFS family permease